MREYTFNDSSEAGYLDDLLKVGSDKPMGYLPVSTIIDHCRVDPTEVAAYLREKGLETRYWPESFCGVYSGALYTYDPHSLNLLLANHSSLLEDTGWPGDADDFVVKVATTFAEHPSLFNLVADAFADYANPLRKP